MSLIYHFEAFDQYYDENKYGFIEKDISSWPQSFRFHYGSWNLIEQKLAPAITRYYKACLFRRYTKVKQTDGGHWINVPSEMSEIKDTPYFEDLEEEFEDCLDFGDFSTYPDDIAFFGEDDERWYFFWLDQDISDCACAMINKTCYYPGDLTKSIPVKTTLEEFEEEMIDPDITYITKELPSYFSFQTY